MKKSILYQYSWGLKSIFENNIRLRTILGKVKDANQKPLIMIIYNKYTFSINNIKLIAKIAI